MIWALFVFAIAVSGLVFLVPGIRLLADPEFRKRFLFRRRRGNERFGRVLPLVADWLRITDTWGLTASEPDDLRSVGWLLTSIGIVAIAGLLVGLIAMASR